VVVIPDGVLVPPLPRPLVTLTHSTLQLWRRERHRDEVVQNLMQMNQDILGIVHVKVLYMFNLIKK
jgi:hypothetical protein